VKFSQWQYGILHKAAELAIKPVKPCQQEIPMKQSNSSARLIGLDTLRALAIALGLMSHYNSFVRHAPGFRAIGSVGWAGVDLFFVLSGYLIGNQLPLLQHAASL
jgi:peptidoglycan/LPS O-acetylase OafA/YrhL